MSAVAEGTGGAAALPWQAPLWARLRSRFPDWPHAWLLSGPVGVGKRHFAQVQSEWVLCERKTADQACGECESCQWLQAGTHPALYRLEPETDAKGRLSKVIKIDQVRELQAFVQQSQRHWRVVVIQPAERLNLAAANALLKTLEEPGERVLFLLVADQLLQLPATVRSRVQRLDLGRIEPEQALHHIQSQARVDAVTAQRLLHLADGAPLQAIALSQGELWGLRSQWWQDWQRLLQQPRLIWQLSAQWQKKLALRDFFVLLGWMVHDVLAQKLSQPVWQDDLDWTGFAAVYELPQLLALQALPGDYFAAMEQNVQEALVYDSVFQQLRPQAAASFGLGRPQP